MANGDHIEIVKQGADAIRSWWKSNPDGRLELERADLQGVFLNGAELRRANLRRANLSGAQLGHAGLCEANLSEANLSKASVNDADLDRAGLTGADLTGAALNGSNLIEAYLDGANLAGANLMWTAFNRTDLQNTDFSKAMCFQTVFADVDLSTVQGLESIQHMGPSIVSVGTLSLSAGTVSEGFLRGCGLGDWEIEAAKLYDPDLPRQKATDIMREVVRLRTESPSLGILISFTEVDSRFVDTLEMSLNKKGIRSWRYDHHATAGRLDKIIDRAMRQNPTVLLVLSKNSVESDWVEDEATRARELEKQLKRDVLCPIALDDAWRDCGWSQTLRTQIKKYNVLPFYKWQDPAAFEEVFQRLLEGLSIFYPPGAPNSVKGTGRYHA